MEGQITITEWMQWKEDIRKKLQETKTNYRRLRSIYFYEDEKYCIRPARDAAEIIAEGRNLHHCVGGDSYLKRHDEGESYILFLRDKNQPEKPYVTVEINAKHFEIKQWYGAYDKKQDEEIISKWLDTYTTRLRCTATGTIEQEGIMIVAR